MTPLPPQDPNQAQLPFADQPEIPAPASPESMQPEPAPTEPTALESAEPSPFTDSPQFEPQPASESAPEPLLFQSISTWRPPEERIPNFGHAALLAVLALVGLLCASLLVPLAVHYHLFGVRTLKQAANNVQYTLGTEAVLYLITLLLSLLVFPLVWHKSFFAGIHLRVRTAFRLRYRLFAAAAVCFFFAMLNGYFMPGPTNAPIDRLIRMPGAAWILFGFGITFAPFFEEMAFRGFLLPSFCTAYDWIAEQITARSLPQPPEPGQPPQHTLFARTVADVLLALPIFAFIPTHAVGMVPRILIVSAWVFILAVWWASTVLRPAPRAATLVPPLDPDGHPVWSFHAMTLASVLSSVPFALMHGQQTSYALGPFLLLVCVSLVLSWVRLLTRSLASSILVHASYNFLLFTFMFLGTSGFRHLNRM